ncbi:hypothetical protein D3C78_1095800 [compost metagenome]
MQMCRLFLITIFKLAISQNIPALLQAFAIPLHFQFQKLHFCRFSRHCACTLSTTNSGGSSYVLTFLRSYVLTFLHSYILTFLHSYVLTFLLPYTPPQLALFMELGRIQRQFFSLSCKMALLRWKLMLSKNPNKKGAV